MLPRERVLTSLNHREPDRVPLDLSGHRSSGVAAIAYAKLRDHLGLPQRPIRVYDLIQQLAIVDEDVLDLLGVDTIELGRGFAQDDESWVDWVLPDGTPCEVPRWTVPERDGNAWVLRSESGQAIGRMPEGVLYFEQCHYPYLEGRGSEPVREAFKESMWHAAAPLDDEALTAGAVQLRASTDRAIIGLFGGNLLETGQFLYRNDNFLMLLAADPRQAHEFLDELVEHHLIELERYLACVGDSIDIILFGDDLGMQRGPQISPQMYREFFMPRHRMMWERAKELADVKVLLHCCGGVFPLLPDLIAAGLDAINPVQISCHGMDPRVLKSTFGKDLAFWGGGCDTQEVLPRGSVDEILEHVTSLIEVFEPGGGYVFQQVHNIMADVPPQNIVALFEAVDRARQRGSFS